MYSHGTGKYSSENVHRSAAQTGGHAKVFHIALDIKIHAAEFSLNPGRNNNL